MMKQFHTIASFILTFLCFLVYTSPVFDLQEKGWLDRCDVKKFQREVSEMATKNPKLTTKKPKNGSGLIEPITEVKFPKRWHFRPLQPTDEVLDVVKEKMTVDGHRRGDGEGVEDWSKDARGFDYDFYNENHEVLRSDYYETESYY